MVELLKGDLEEEEEDDDEEEDEGERAINTASKEDEKTVLPPLERLLRARYRVYPPVVQKVVDEPQSFWGCH